MTPRTKSGCVCTMVCVSVQGPSYPAPSETGAVANRRARSAPVLFRRANAPDLFRRRIDANGQRAVSDRSRGVPEGWKAPRYRTRVPSFRTSASALHRGGRTPGLTSERGACGPDALPHRVSDPVSPMPTGGILLCNGAGMVQGNDIPVHDGLCERAHVVREDMCVCVR